MKIPTWEGVPDYVLFTNQAKTFLLLQYIKRLIMIALGKFSDIPVDQWLGLLNHPKIRKHMPLAYDDFTHDSIIIWIAEKEKIWQEQKYGPWTISVNGLFAGWGGLQPEHGEPDLALVLHPNYWGMGGPVIKKILNQIKLTTTVETITIHLPESRTRLLGIKKLGFIQECDIKLEGQKFTRYRLNLSSAPGLHC